mmetsp:Transcript_5680/g.6561  ORF Transcript_5680/g.6561 Transcript_5680/m.6561 type:complete len:574 (-) Transcript_5680:117-1838(-)|eukprot:CAMPEP_0184017404 /NCGR_PEP_ID=MMETSP0954-20121128/7516_1 /TAXON_ID=627963 /ORGANISM="Aplanochytrium sp, Strain PBS07" /LENGTH=573 /DNA_ID=CAMNT_0026298633 /DNA_START=126 /DNA_END=1847 /DNA_ORIENTATION=-
MAFSSELPPEDLSSLISFCPTLLDYLRNNSKYTADMFLQSYREDYDAVDKNLSRIRSELMAAGGDMSLATLQNLCSTDQSGYPIPLSVWANAVRRIMTQAVPRLIPAELGSDLIATLIQLNEAVTVRECCLILGPLLDKLPRKHFDTLGEFCALIRDTSTNSSVLSSIVGPSLILPSVDLQASETHAASYFAAGALFDLLVTLAEPLFGRSASERIYHSWGSFRQQNTLDMRVNYEQCLLEKQQDTLKRTLRAYYEWIDPACALHVETIFDLHPFVSIAEGVYDKYNIWPPGWAELYYALSGKTVESGPNNYQVLNKSIPQDTVSLHKSQHPVVYRDITRIKLDDIIDEIISNERVFYDILNAVVVYFGNSLREVVEGRRGAERRDGLGLDKDEVEMICGGNLRAVRNVSATLLAKLEMLTLVKNVPIDAAGRAKIVIGAFSEMLGSMRAAYFPFVGSYKRASALLVSRIELMKKKKKAKQQYHFIRIWQVISNSHNELKGKRLDSVLIMPVQRVYQTKLRFERLKKDAEKLLTGHDDVLEELGKLVKEIGVLATDLNNHMARAKSKTDSKRG